MILRFLTMAMAVFLLSAPGETRAESPIFSARDGIALGGYDVVAFFEQQRAIAGDQDHALMWKGVVWHFVSAQNQSRFEANPRAYAPVFGGYCAYAMSQGYLAPGDPQLWLVEEGQLYLLNNSSVHRVWQQERGDLLAQAQGHWPAVLRD